MKQPTPKKKNFFQRFWEAYWRPEMLILPGQIAFFLFLSVVPTLTLIGYAASYLNISNNLVETFVSNVLSEDVSKLLTPILTATKIDPRFFITLGIGYFVASNGMSSIIIASNTIYGIKDSGFFKRRLKAIIMELVIVVLFLFILIVPLLGENIINLLEYIKLAPATMDVVSNVFNFLKGPLSWIIIFIALKAIYTMAPDRKVKGSSVNGGTLFTTIGWILITGIYSYYINNFANYSLFYGGLANIIILMLWVYFLSVVFVIGLAMNYHQDLEETGVIDVVDEINEQKIIDEQTESNEKPKEEQI